MGAVSLREQLVQRYRAELFLSLARVAQLKIWAREWLCKNGLGQNNLSILIDEGTFTGTKCLAIEPFFSAFFWAISVLLIIPIFLPQFRFNILLCIIFLFINI